MRERPSCISIKLYTKELTSVLPYFHQLPFLLYICAFYIKVESDFLSLFLFVASLMLCIFLFSLRSVSFVILFSSSSYWEYFRIDGLTPRPCSTEEIRFIFNCGTAAFEQHNTFSITFPKPLLLVIALAPNGISF